MFNGDIILVANSPGELSALVSPVAKKLKERTPESRLILFLTPCQYSAGTEVEFARKNLNVDLVVPASDYKKWLLTSALPDNFALKNKGIVLFLGGDLLHATLIAKKLNFKAYAYLAGKNVSWTSAFEKFFVPEKELFEKKIPPSKLREVGDLMADLPQALPREVVREQWKISADCPLVAMLPGSRLWEIKHVLPLYEKIGKILKTNKPDMQLMLVVSPFTTLAEIESIKEHRIFDVFAPFASLPAADLALTIPGTNTAQIAALGLPMLVIFPLDNIDAIPLEGLLHYITSIPVIGPALKRIVAEFICARTKYFALPNIKAQNEVVPEIRGKIDPKKTAEKILAMLDNKEALKTTAMFLRHLMKSSGAAQKIAEAILNENPA